MRGTEPRRRPWDRILPTSESVRHNPWLRWLGPRALHPRLWRLTRRGLALGVAIGVFFGLLIPLAQIPLSAAVAIAVRANLPAALAGTLVTNPLTVGPVYYGAWRLGSELLREPVREGEQPPAPPETAPVPVDPGWLDATLRRVRAVGKPLLLGLAIIAAALGLLTYLLVSWAWAAKVLWKRRRRRRFAATSC